MLDVDGITPVEYYQVAGGEKELVDAGVPEEIALSIYVNGFELATFMCSPVQQKALAMGFLANEALIEGLDEIRIVHLCARGTCVDVWLSHAVQRPARSIITSGCGGGITFDDLSRQRERLTSTLRVTPEQIHQLMRQLNSAGQLYRQVRGVHTSALSDGSELLLVAEDVGRHNTVDKLRGMALMDKMETRDLVLMSSGRISSEMLNKAAGMGIPIVVSRTSPTSLSVTMARAWGITLIGYVRGGRMNVYTGAERLGLIR